MYYLRCSTGYLTAHIVVSPLIELMNRLAHTDPYNRYWIECEP